MKSRNISAVVVGADRVAANGDTANKIGTYQVIFAPSAFVATSEVFVGYLTKCFCFFFSLFTDCHSR